jgi:hypothetical protein
MSGLYVSLTEGDTVSYAVTIDAKGKELTRERLAAPAGRGGGGGGGGNAGRGAAGAPAAASPAGTSPGGAPPAAAPAGQAAATPTGGRATPPPGTQVGSSGRRPPVLKPGEWNDVSILATAATLRPTFGGVGTIDEKNAGRVTDRWRSM